MGIKDKKFLVYDAQAGDYFKAPGEGTTDIRRLAHHYSYEQALSAVGVTRNIRLKYTGRSPNRFRMIPVGLYHG
ncbi:hypothetical protein HOU66_gp15 [Pectobacterium phage Arno160]|uniref:Uncharacterized protein n=1 Tax=Pectobacterium phage Arno160 TaxID=2488835 RepID=A0A3G8F1X1_9CAUD|nr:hypothetical protein HOU66_gp15 [Pectobacterium phage Arno160]AZF88077.1 hypothetical protein Arno160_gp15 [Pectobacterium phage Arno160]